jgi:hypothetical protein
MSTTVIVMNLANNNFKKVIGPDVIISGTERQNHEDHLKKK